MDLTVWLPAAGTGPGLLLIQEIFGVGEYIRAVADDLAELGYVEEDAGHAFHNRMSATFHIREPAARAWRRTEEFLQRHLPAKTRESAKS